MQGIPPELLSMLGGGMMGMGGGRPGKQRGRDIGVQLGVTLEEMYNGSTKEVDLPRQILCPKCKGTGSKSGKSFKCEPCNGQGVRFVRQQIGPGMIQQSQMRCDACGGRGTNITESDKCGECHGKQVKEDPNRVLKVVIPPGAKSNDRIPFKGEGDQSPDIDIPGDIIVILKQIEHESVVRKGNDLFVTKTITLMQALTSFQIEHTQLDGRKLLIKNKGIVTPGMVKTVKGEGMPGKDRGDLNITFNIEFPRILAEDQVDMLKKFFAVKQPAPLPHPASEYEECFMDDYSPDEWKRIGVGEEEEEDAEEEGGPTQVRCSHQ